MAFGKTNSPMEGGEQTPKKADIILKANQDISVKQDELIRQTKLSNSRIDAVLDLFQKNMQETANFTKQTAEMFNRLQSENNALRQELLYLAKQSENIYAGLADKISELTEQARNRENAYASLADKVNDLAEQNKNGERSYTVLIDGLTELSEQTKRSEGDYSELLVRLSELADKTKTAEDAYTQLSDKLDGYGEQNKRNEIAYAELSDKLNDVVDQSHRTDNTYADLAFKIADISEQNKRTENACVELSDKIIDLTERSRRNEGAYLDINDKIEVVGEKIETVSERIEKIGEDNLRAQYAAAAAAASQPAAQPVMPVQTVVKEQIEIDYDKLAEKIAELTVSEVISPDLIASKVAEQVIIPDSFEGKVNIDEEKIANEVVSRINLHLNDEGKDVAVNLNVDLDEDKIARNVLAGINLGMSDDRPVAQPVDVEIDEEKIARLVSDNINIGLNEEKIARELADIIKEEGIVYSEVAPASAVSAVPLNIDEEELADRIALKVGSLKSEDFEIIVDDEGCSSISKDICDKLDYSMISDAVAEKLRYALDLAAANEPDYEEMANRISEKITVAGINEDAIADKAAAVLSNYLPDFDTDEIADKVMNAVIDVLNAQLSSMTMPQIDNDAICNTITDRIIESQADHDYDIVIDEDGIGKITELVAEEVEKGSAERFAKVEEAIAGIKEMLENGGFTAPEGEEVHGDDIARLEDAIAEIKTMLENGVVATNSQPADVSQVEDMLVEIKEMLANGGETVSDSESETSADIAQLENAINEIKDMLASGVVVSNSTATEIASTAVYEEPVVEEEVPLITVSDLVAGNAPEIEDEEDEEEDERPERDIDDSDDMDDELMPGSEMGGVDFANMMKYNRSFIARIIQSPDEYKQYYGAVKHALLSYKKVNSNIAWGAERFNKGRETIARFKIRGKTLCLYLALDPNAYKTSVYHHLDATDNKSMAGTPMMVKIKSALGVKKAIRLIDEMLEARGAEKRFVPERDYAAMYPYETIEELIEDGIVKDVRKKK
ncbi:MAG: hypothetical protein K2O41_01165 [Clostridia bacterium]|nr:hypothetical protein [Clostridia bacterium]